MTGEGQYIDVSMQEAVAATTEHVNTTYNYTGESAVRCGFRHGGQFVATWRCQDGYASITTNTRKAWDDLRAWMHRDGQPAGWKLGEDGSMEVTRGNILTRRSFGDVRIHLEFRTPLMAEARGQARGNSGVYVQGRYEVQVLDSFGLEPMDNGCGGVYRIAPPRVNASLPPLQWQTYEIIFRAPRFDASGSKTANARITVRHNGQVIHLNRELPRLTPGGVSNEESERGPLLLQDHRDPVQYRNIWVLPLD